MIDALAISGRRRVHELLQAIIKMRAYAFLAIAVATTPAAATEIVAAHALGLATDIAKFDPDLTPLEREQVLHLDINDDNLGFPAGRQIIVKADKVICRSSHLDPNDQACEIFFPKQTVNLNAKAALGLWAGLVAEGGLSGNMAGSTYGVIHGLKCIITPSLIERDWDAAATCTFSPGG